MLTFFFAFSQSEEQKLNQKLQANEQKLAAVQTEVQTCQAQITDINKQIESVYVHCLLCVYYVCMISIAVAMKPLARMCTCLQIFRMHGF